MLRRLRPPPRFPYTTLFRSVRDSEERAQGGSEGKPDCPPVLSDPWPLTAGPSVLLSVSDTGGGMDAETQSHIFERSEEHTSELQSLTNIVCRLLLEKKKTLH